MLVQVESPVDKWLAIASREEAAGHPRDAAAALKVAAAYEAGVSPIPAINEYQDAWYSRVSEAEKEEAAKLARRRWCYKAQSMNCSCCR